MPGNLLWDCLYFQGRLHFWGLLLFWDHLEFWGPLHFRGCPDFLGRLHFGGYFPFLFSTTLLWLSLCSRFILRVSAFKFEVVFFFVGLLFYLSSFLRSLVCPSKVIWMDKPINMHKWCIFTLLWVGLGVGGGWGGNNMCKWYTHNFFKQAHFWHTYNQILRLDN